MDNIRLCLLVCLAITCLVQPMMSLSAMVDGTFDYDTNQPVQITDDMFQLRDAKDPTLLLKRFRRQNSQWYVGSHHFNDYNHEGGSRRWANSRQRQNQNQGVYGGGQIVDA